MLLLSDDFDEGSIALAERLASTRREVLNIQILTTEERDFPFQGGHRFRDVETTLEVLTDAMPSRTAFIAEFASARRALAARLSVSGIKHIEYFLDQPVDTPLRRLFMQGKARFQESV